MALRQTGGRDYRAMPWLVIAACAILAVLTLCVTAVPEHTHDGAVVEESSGVLPDSVLDTKDAPEGGHEVPDERAEPSLGLQEELGRTTSLDALEAQPWTTVVVEEGELAQVATEALEGYRDAGDCVLAYAGYLDLVGSVWGCVVRGDRWAEVCVVNLAEEGRCERRVLRLEADELAEVLSDQG